MAQQIAQHPDHTGDTRFTLSRRAAWVLVALCAWTLYVWITRIWIIAGQHHGAGFVAVHTVLGVISIAFGLGAGWIGWRALRSR
jgi:hypothetical protein